MKKNSMSLTINFRDTAERTLRWAAAEGEAFESARGSYLQYSFICARNRVDGSHIIVFSDARFQTVAQYVLIADDVIQLSRLSVTIIDDNEYFYTDKGRMCGAPITSSIDGASGQRRDGMFPVDVTWVDVALEAKRSTNATNAA